MSWSNKVSYVLLLFTVIFTALAYGTVHQPIIAVFYVVVAAMTVLWVIDGYNTGEFNISLSPLQLPLVGAAVYGFIQTVPFGWHTIAGIDNVPRTISVDTFSTRVNALHFAALSLFFSVGLTLINSAKRIRRTVTVLTIFGFIFAFFAILQGVLSPTKIYGIYERQFAQPYGSFVNRHNFAAYMEMTMSLPLALVLTGVIKRDQRLLYLTAILLMGVALFLSGSRGGLVALFAEVLLIVLVTAPMRGGRKIVLRLALSGAMLAAVIAGTIFVGGESSLTRIAETATSKNVSANRTQIWTVTLNVISQNFPFGAGLGAFGVAYTPVDPMSGLERVEQAHNDYLETVADAGIVGIGLGALFIFALVSTFLKNIYVKNDIRRAIAIGSGAGIFAVLIHSLFDFVLHTTAVSVLFIILMTLLVASGSVYDDDTNSESSTNLSRKRKHYRS